jgi:hypothetical protein
MEEQQPVICFFHLKGLKEIARETLKSTKNNCSNSILWFLAALQRFLFRVGAFVSKRARRFLPNIKHYMLARMDGAVEEAIPQGCT